VGLQQAVFLIDQPPLRTPTPLHHTGEGSPAVSPAPPCPPYPPPTPKNHQEPEGGILDSTGCERRGTRSMNVHTG
jgi:hypothetical protein